MCAMATAESRRRRTGLAGRLLAAVVLWSVGAAEAQKAPAPAGSGLPPAADVAEAASRPPLSLGTVLPLRLEAGEAAYFRLPEGPLVATTRRLARGTDTVMALLDAQGRVLDEDDDGGDEGLASRIEVTADQTGPLFLRVALLEGRGGAFDLALEAPPPVPPESPPRTLTEAAVAAELVVGQAVPLRLGGRQEAYFRLPAGTQDLVLLTRGLQGGTDTVLALLDANGRELEEDDDSGEENLASRLEVPAGQRRPLYVRARVLGGEGTFELVALPDLSPPGPAFPVSIRAAADAPALEPGRPVAMRLRRGQSAYFRLPDGDIAVLTRDLQRGADTVLALLDAEGRVIEEDDDGGGGLASRIEVAATQDRPVFIRARLLDDGPGAFTLAVEAAAPQRVTFPTSIEEARIAAPLEAGAAVPIRLRRGQSAFFRLPPGELVVLTRTSDGGTDTVLELLDSSGRVFAEDDDGGGGLASRLTVPAGGRKGEIFVRASILGGGAGSFDLVLETGSRR